MLTFAVHFQKIVAVEDMAGVFSSEDLRKIWCNLFVVKKAEPEGNAFDLPVDPCSNPDPYA